MTKPRFSIIIAKAISDSNVSNSQLRTLAVLGTFSDTETGWCYPRQKVIGNILGKSRAAVSKDIKHLVELGYIEVRPRFREDGSQTSNMYRVVYDLSDEVFMGGVTPGVTGGVTPGVTGGVTPGVTPLTSHLTSQLTDGGDMEKDDYKNRLIKAMGRGYEKYKDILGNVDVSSYPPDVQEIIFSFAVLWNIRTPVMPRKRTEKSPATHWIVGARELMDACGEFGVAALVDYRLEFERFMKNNKGVAPHTVASPKSLVNVVRGHTGIMREKNRTKDDLSFSYGASEVWTRDGRVDN